MNLDLDTIVAIATPPGRGGIGIVRLSGPGAGEVLLPWLAMEGRPAARRAHFVRIVDPATAHLVDEAVITFFPAPRSYTGEDVLEVASHGSPVVLEFLVERALAGGARLAHPGEFTQRAFLNGRLDLTQAEAVRDLIDATTMHQARLAAEQMGGALSRRLAPVKQALVGLIAALEAGIDFAEDDIDLIADEDISGRIAEVERPLLALADSFRYGRIVRSGLTLAIVGAPNVGKSSLFNRLLDRNRAIVTATPGTTRDLISERTSIGGVPVELIDTAGLRSTVDEAEALGIAKSHEALATADLVLVVVDAGRAMSSEQMEQISGLEGRAHLLVCNKVDLLPNGHQRPIAKARDHAIETSALTGYGIETLRQAIATEIQMGSAIDSGLVTNLRQHEAIRRSIAALVDARVSVTQRIPHEMILLDLYAALRSLDELTGSTTPDDILNLIFSSFCIGK